MYRKWIAWGEEVFLATATSVLQCKAETFVLCLQLFPLLFFPLKVLLLLFFLFPTCF